jgi:hypothetical protein
MPSADLQSITGDCLGLAYLPDFASGLNRAGVVAWRVTHCVVSSNVNRKWLGLKMALGKRLMY